MAIAEWWNFGLPALRAMESFSLEMLYASSLTMSARKKGCGAVFDLLLLFDAAPDQGCAPGRYPRLPPEPFGKGRRFDSSSRAPITPEINCRAS
jgi:hypothetical protein